MRNYEKGQQLGLEDLSMDDLLNRAAACSAATGVYEGQVAARRELEAIQAIIQGRKEVDAFLRDYFAMSDSFGMEATDVVFARREEVR